MNGAMPHVRQTAVEPAAAPRLVLSLNASQTHVYSASASDGTLSRAARLSWPVHGRRSRNAQPVQRALKRALDLTVASVALIVASPLLVMIAIGIKLTMGGPVVFGHNRVGRDGRMFRCLKFRSMVANGDDVLRAYLEKHPEAQSEWSEKFKLANDPRITRFGRILRRSSLDELPQFFNILRGDMSCVGPRPIVEGELQRYGAFAADYLSVRPGLTGAWQVSGRSTLSYEQRVELDVDYIRNWSLKRDIEILVRTIPAVMKTNDAA